MPYAPNAIGGDGSDIGAFELKPPGLKIVRSGNQVILSWSTNESGYTLESAALLANPPQTNIWTAVPGAAALIGGNYIVTNNTAAGQLLYRLRSH